MEYLLVLDVCLPMIVVLNAKFARLLEAHANKKDGEKRRQDCRILLVKAHRHLTFIAVFTVHEETSLLYAFQRSMQANKHINLW